MIFSYRNNMLVAGGKLSHIADVIGDVPTVADCIRTKAGFCEGFRMPVIAMVAARTGTGVGNPSQGMKSSYAAQ